MRIVVTVDVQPEGDEVLDRVEVAKDLQLFLMDFAQTEKSNDVRGGFYVTGATSRELW
jgi:hypothetical protein